MAHDKFNAQFLLNSSSATADSTVFNFNANINDNVGVYTGLDASVGDIIVLDTSAVEAGTVSKYKLLTFTSQAFDVIAGTMKYIDDGAAIDPGGSLGIVGVIGAAAPETGLPWMASSDIQGYPLNIIEYAQNIANFETEDPNLNSLQTDPFTLNSTDITNKYVDLSQLPSPPASVTFQVAGGPQQFSPGDWALVANGSGALQRISWSGLSLDGILAINDQIVIQYQTVL